MKLIIIKLSFLFLLTVQFNYAQETVIKVEEPIKIKSGTVLYLNGLSLNPSSDFTINNSNELLKSSTSLDPQSINRVYDFNSLLTGFEGEIIFYYDESELNGVTESNLVLQIKDGSNNWNIIDSAVLDTNNNTLTFNTVSSLNFSSVTASASGITLSINKFNNLEISLYPNPTTSNIKINTDLKTEIIIYNLIGQEILKTRKKNIDVSQLSNGTYIFIVKDISTNNFNSYKVIKI
jgi:hypothetical protein